MNLVDFDSRNESVNCYVSSTVSYIIAAYIRHTVAVACFTKPFRFRTRNKTRFFGSFYALLRNVRSIASYGQLSRWLHSFRNKLKARKGAFWVSFLTEIFLTGATKGTMFLSIDFSRYDRRFKNPSSLRSKRRKCVHWPAIKMYYELIDSNRILNF